MLKQKLEIRNLKKGFLKPCDMTCRQNQRVITGQLLCTSCLSICLNVGEPLKKLKES